MTVEADGWFFPEGLIQATLETFLVSKEFMFVSA